MLKFMFLILVPVLWIGSCATVVQKRTDPLIGKIIRTVNQTEVTYAELLEKALTSDVIYLGENHDNPDHHEIQLRIIKDIIARGKRPQLGFEFFSVDQTGHLISFATPKNRKMSSHSPAVREKVLRRNLNWQDRTDKSWKFYFQFVDLAKEQNLKIFGADLPKSLVRRMINTGMDSLTAVEISLLQPTNFSDDAYRQLMFESFKASHCGYAHEAYQKKMYQTWIARNDRMALSIVSMLKASPEEPVVVILGGGHTRHNMGVYERAAHLKPGIRQLNIGLREIALDPVPLGEYCQTTQIRQQEFAPSHEYLWFTQRTSYEDPCRRFRKQLERMKKTGTKK